MATTNTCKKCGCEDSFMPSPAPCPTPQGCPNPEPCSEVMDAQCVIYTGPNIICDTDIVVTTNDTVAEAIENVVDYFCSRTVSNPTNKSISNVTVPNPPGSVVVTHNLNTINIVISIIIDGGLPTSAIIPGIDYVYTVLNENQIEIFATVSWSGNDVIVTVIG